MSVNLLHSPGGKAYNTRDTNNNLVHGMSLFYIAKKKTLK